MNLYHMSFQEIFMNKILLAIITIELSHLAKFRLGEVIAA